jgi:hypothetical protein
MESASPYTYSPFVKQPSTFDVCCEYFYGTGSDGQPSTGRLAQKLAHCASQGLNMNAAVSGYVVHEIRTPLDFLLESLEPHSQLEILCHWHYRCHGMTCMDEDFGRSGDPAKWCDLCEKLKPVILEETLAGIEYLKQAALIGNPYDSPTSSGGSLQTAMMHCVLACFEGTPLSQSGRACVAA